MIVEELVSVLGLEIRDTGLADFRSSLTATIGKMGLVVAGALSAAAALGSLAASAAGDISATAEFARSIGSSTDELLRLEHAAKRTGASSGALRGILAGITEQLVQWKTGGANQLFEALTPLGIDLTKDGKPRDATEIYLDLADAVRNAKDQTFALGQAAKAGFGVEFFENLKLGRAGILAIAAEADVPSSSAIAASERLVASMDRFKTVMGAFVADTGAPLLEGASSFIDSLVSGSRSKGFKEFKELIVEINGLLVDAIAGVIAFYREVAKALPEGSTAKAIIAAAGLAFAYSNPATAGVAATGVAASSLYKDRNIPAPQEVVALGEAFSRLSDKISGFMDMLPGTGFQPPAADFLPRGSEPGDRHAQQRTARTIVENLTIHVGSPREASEVVDRLDRNEAINEAAERGTGAIDR